MGGINRYDSPAQDRYFNTYVPLPFEQIMPVVAQRQSQLQREQDMLAKTYEDTQNIKYIPGSPDEAYVRNYLGKTGDLVNKYYGQDLSDPIVKQQLRSEFNKITDRQTLQNIETSQSSWAANQKLKAQLKAEGLYDEALDEDPASKWNTQAQGAYSYITSTYKNPRPTAETFFNNLKASDLGPSGDYFFSGVTSGDINRVADAKWGEFANTSEGSLYVKKIAKEQGLDYTNPDVKRQIATEYLKGVGKEFTYRNREGATLEAQVRAAQEKKGGADQNKVLTWQTQPIPTTKKFDPLGVGKIKFDDKGDILMEQSVSRPTEFSGAYGTLNVSPSELNYKSKEEAQAKLNIIRDKIPQLKGMSDSETYKAYEDITNDARSFGTLPLIDISDRSRAGLANYIGNTLTNKDIYVEDSLGSTDTTPANDKSDNSALKEIGWTPQLLSEQLQEYGAGRKSSIRVSGLDPGARKPGMVQLEVLDKSKANKGKWRKLFVDTNREFEQITAPGQQVFQMMRNMEEGQVLVGYDRNNGVPVVANVKTNITKDPVTNKWRYTPTIEKGYATKDGYVKISDMRIDDILNKQLLELEESGLLNSQIGETAPTNSFQ